MDFRKRRRTEESIIEVEFGLSKRPKQNKRCPHGKQHAFCKECGGSMICSHGRQRNKCKDCGASSYCEHGRQKSQCKDCGGAGICEHSKIRSHCVTCIGPSVCEHRKLRRFCKDCGGSEICEHSRLRSGCKDCKGSQICKHSRLKAFCKDCEGSQICLHSKHRANCTECRGSQICTHGRQKYSCRECGGSMFCIHAKRKTRCKECGGAEICDHGRLRTRCKECGGSEICEHGRRRSFCGDCITIEAAQNNKRFCNTCTKMLNHKRVRAGIRECSSCEGRKPPRIEHLVAAKLLVMVKFPIWMKDDTLVGGHDECCSQQRRPDMLWIANNRAVIVEIDENGGHPDREIDCELAKIEQQSTAIKRLLGEDIQTFILRFNPDEFDGGNVTLESRILRLAAEVNNILDGTEEFHEIYVPRVVYFYYHSKCQKHIDAAVAAKEALVVLKIIQ